MLRVVELFAGIGAQAAALDLIGAEWESPTVGGTPIAQSLPRKWGGVAA